MDGKQRNELLKKFLDLKKEIFNLRSQLNKLNEQKEFWFKKKEEFQKYVIELIKKIKGIKVEKDGFNQQLQELKKQRDFYNNQVKQLINKIRELNKEKKLALKKYNIRIDPYKIKERIDKLELSIETEAFSFKKEEKVMAEIKKLKKLYQEGSIVMDIINKIQKVSQEITLARDKANEFHRKLQLYIKEGKGGYSEFIDISKRIDDLKAKQEKAFQTFLNFKTEFKKINDLLKSRLLETNKINESLNGYKKGSIDKRKQIEDRIIKKKALDVEDKLKKKKKLTTQDLLVFQSKKEEEK